MEQKNVIKLSGKQGCLLTLGILLVIGGILYWTANRFPQSYSGTVVVGQETLTPFGCNSSRTGNTLMIPLRPEPQPEGFHVENRAIILKDGSNEQTMSKPRAVDVTTISWRNEQQEVTPMNCATINDHMTVFSKRRGGRFYRREDLWSGTIQATCDAPGLGSVTIDLSLQHCDW
jgi:hypothetical protein